MSRKPPLTALRRRPLSGAALRAGGFALPHVPSGDDLVSRPERRRGMTVDPVPLDATRNPSAVRHPVLSVNSASLSQRLIILTTTGILNGTTSLILEADPNRRYLEIFNLDQMATVYLGFDSAPTSSNGRPILALTPFLPVVVPTNSIYAVASVANVSILVLYG